MRDGVGSPPAEPPLRLAVIGGGEATAEERRLAWAVGKAAGEAGAILICGGRSGVMEEAARGCSQAGGLTVGLLPDRDPSAANQWIALPLATGLGDARNALVVGTADAVVAVGGKWGTLSEMALARKGGKSVAMLGTPPATGLDFPAFSDPAEAVAWALEQARSARL